MNLTKTISWTMKPSDHKRLTEHFDEMLMDTIKSKVNSLSTITEVAEERALHDIARRMETEWSKALLRKVVNGDYPIYFLPRRHGKGLL